MREGASTALVSRADLAWLLGRALRGAQLGQGATSAQAIPWPQPTQQPLQTPFQQPQTQGAPTVPARFTIRAFLPETLAPLPGARISVILKYANGQEEPFAQGFTDAAGSYVFAQQVPVRLTPAQNVPGGPAIPQPGQDVPLLKVVVSSDRGELRGASMAQATPAFKAIVIDNIKANQPVDQSFSVVACPPGTDLIVCSAARAQRMWKDIYDAEIVAWGNSPQSQGLAADVAHANVKFDHPALQAEWYTFSWWIGDLGIPPKDWPDLIKWTLQARAVFNSVPFPLLPGAPDLFKRCARGLPLWKGMSFATPKLYSKTWSSYFPRSDQQIEMDLAAIYLISMPAVFGCIQHKLTQKVKEIERSRKAYAMLGMATIFMLGPMAGGAFPALLLTTLTETIIQLREHPLEGYDDVIIKGVSTAGELASGNMASIGGLIALGLGLLLAKLAPDLDPTVRGLATGAAGGLAGDAAADVLGGATSTTGAANFLTLQSLGSAAAGLAIKLLADSIKAQGVKGVKGLRDTVLGLNQMPELMIPFYLWVLNKLLLGALLEAAAKQAGLGDIDVVKDITGPEAQRATDAGIEVPGTRRISPAAEVAVGGGAAVGLLALVGAFGQL